MRPLSACMLLTASLLLGAAAAPVSLVQNEYDFAAAVAQHGVRDGFLQYLDKQAIGFSPTPAKAYDAYSKAKPSGAGAKLLWYPSYALLASSGDFGVDTGPWTYEAVGKDGGKVQAYGDWLTVWHRDQDGQWKALFDGGIGHDSANTEKALAHDVQVDQMQPAMGPVPAMAKVHEQLMQSERAFTKMAADQSLRQAFQDSGSSDLRLLWEKSQPILGRDKAVQVAPAVASDMTWDPMGSGAASSGDLGYVYGETFRLADSKHLKPIGVYMHVWRREAGSWKLLIAEDVPL